MKRERKIEQSVTIGNCLKFLPQRTKLEAFSYYSPSNTERVFECKTCHKHFPSFQALGGHRASHKKPKFVDGNVETIQMNASTTKPKTHECSICGLEFSIGQALGGHMRRHRAAALNDHEHVQEDPMAMSSGVSAMKKNSNRVLLDLNLTPLENNLEFLKHGKVAQPAALIDCFL